MILVIVFLWYVYDYLSICKKLLLHDILGHQRPNFLCVKFSGGLANHMFQYAFGYSMMKSRKLQFIIEKNNILTHYFNVKPNTWEDHGFISGTCECFKRYSDSLDCGYDNSFENIHSGDMYFEGFFQSWKYFIKYEDEIREIFRFQENVVDDADRQLRAILLRQNVNIKDGTMIVGVHIRNGDYSKPYFARFGYNIPPASYLQKAFQYFKNLFKKTLFIVCTNDLKWTNKVLSDEKDYYIVKGNPAAVDMALLSMTNHTIMTVGTFGWMIGWLTRGTTVHYKSPYVEGTRFAAEFHSNNSDHFYPGWISMA